MMPSHQQRIDIPRPVLAREELRAPARQQPQNYEGKVLKMYALLALALCK